MPATAPPPSGPGLPPSAPPDPAPGLPEPRRGRPLARLVLGSLVALLCAGGIGALLVLDQVHTLRDALKQNAALPLPANTLAPAGWGQPETLLLVGDDQRTLTGEFKYYSHAVLPHSNEMLLVRLDPSKPYISMMSIPRELMVTINPPGRPSITTRFNYAYTAGGIPLLLATIKQALGLPVNHVMVVTFGRFKRAIDEMGCVYSTVDRRYYHVNVPGGPQYQEIDLQPGYQSVCGAQALEFVSYRHDDTSLVRDARDQSLLLDVKQQYGPSLADNIGKFEHIFGQAVQTDSGLHSSTELLNLIGTLISAQGRRVRQVKFAVNLVPAAATPCACVTATSQQISSSVHNFLFGSSPPPKRGVAAAAHAVQGRRGLARLPLAPVTADELAQARGAGQRMPFPFEYPAVQDRGGSVSPVYLRDYSITAPDHSSYPIYVAVFSAGQLGQFYDVQGTTWRTAPLLDGAQQTVSVGGRTYFLHYQGDQVQTVAWQEHGAAYWVRNSLNDVLPNGELLAIAEQMRPVTSGTPTTGPAALRAAVIPTRVVPAPPTPTSQLIGGLAALITLVLAPAMLVLMWRRRKERRRMWAAMQGVWSVQERLSHALAGVTPLPAPPATFASTTIYGPRRSRSGAVAVAAALVLVLAGGGVALWLTHRASAARRVAHVHRPAVRAGPVVPAIPVAVLNSSSIAGAARSLARRLQARGVRIAAVGNLAEPRPSGVWILYGPGSHASAAELAAVLGRRPAVLAPIDPTAQAAAGAGVRVVVVIA